jgi:hypothetical protein
MSLLTAERRGSQRPRRLSLPERKVSSAGPDATEFAADAGLFLDEWQAWVLEEALAERDDERWAAFECCLIVPRQNGKGSILEALELYHLFVLRTPLVLHSAHEFATAREHFLRLKTLIEGSSLLADTEHIYEANGNMGIVTRDGARLRVVARSNSSVRGFSGDLLILDEAFKLSEAAVGSMAPALSARPNPQIWYTSSAPHADSHVLHGIRARGLADDSPRLFFAEWGNEPDVSDDDPDAVPDANPGYPDRLTPENLEAEAEMLKAMPEEYRRERLGVPSVPDTSAGVFPPGTWASCLDEHSKIVGKPVLVLDVAPGMEWASFAGAGRRADGLLHIELRERHAGTGWVIQWAAGQSHPVWLDPKGPAGGLIDELEKAGVTVLQVPDGLIPKACSAIQNHVVNGTVRQIGQGPLNAAVVGAAIKPAGDSWRWSRTASPVDITPLVAVTIAVGVLEQGPKVPHFYA